MIRMWMMMLWMVGKAKKTSTSKENKERSSWCGCWRWGGEGMRRKGGWSLVLGVVTILMIKKWRLVVVVVWEKGNKVKLFRNAMWKSSNYSLNWSEISHQIPNLVKIMTLWKQELRGNLMNWNWFWVDVTPSPFILFTYTQKYHFCIICWIWLQWLEIRMVCSRRSCRHPKLSR